METKDLEAVNNIYKAITSPEKDVEAFKIENPAIEVEKSLVDFLKHRLSKLKEDVTFESEIKETIMARLSEASFPQLITLLEIIQKNANIGVEKVLAPFIAQSGEKTLLDSAKDMNRKSQISEEIFEETNDKNILQSLVMLNQLMDIANKSKS